MFQLLWVFRLIHTQLIALMRELNWVCVSMFLMGPIKQVKKLWSFRQKHNTTHRCCSITGSYCNMGVIKVDQPARMDTLTQTGTELG